MRYENGKAKEVKIAYVGGGSRGWARGLMSDLALEEKMSGTVYLYDIDGEAAKDNAIIGNRMNDLADCKTHWEYIATEDEKEAYENADFVVISILPGTFDEMESDVHTPEEYGIYQSVGDSVGPGGIVRAMRTVPMFEKIALNVKKYCPKAWVINYTNPMTMCTKTLYEVFPEIKAFGCCHEVFAVQELFGNVWNANVEKEEDKVTDRHQVEINLYGINHFTWIDKAQFRGQNLMPIMKEYAEKNPEGMTAKNLHWMNRNFASNQKVKFDLFKRYGVLAAAGDRHLSEFCPGDWYLKDPQTVADNKFALTTVAWRKGDQQDKIKQTKAIIAGTEPLEIKPTGEEGVSQMVALLGLGSYVTNVNVPNVGQIPTLPLGAVVETNAFFSSDTVTPLMAGPIPEDINHLIIRHVYMQETVVKASLKGDYEGVFRAFLNDPNVNLPLDKSRELFDKMLEKTKAYLPYYEEYKKNRK